MRVVRLNPFFFGLGLARSRSKTGFSSFQLQPLKSLFHYFFLGWYIYITFQTFIFGLYVSNYLFLGEDINKARAEKCVFYFGESACQYNMKVAYTPDALRTHNRPAVYLLVDGPGSKNGIETFFY